MDKIVLCADIGTSSLKAALIDSNGTVYAKSRISFIKCYTKHAAQEWMDCFSRAAAELFSIICDKTVTNKKVDFQYKYISGICISGNGPTVTDTKGNTILWTEDLPLQISGIKTKSLFIPRLLYFKEKYNQEWNESPFILSGPEYLIYLLTDKALTILPEQRYQTAYWNNEDLLTNGFSKEEIKKLPPFVFSGHNAGFLNKDKLKELNKICPLITDKTQVFCGAPDFVSALVGTNTLEPGKICDRAGSSEGINMCTLKPVTGKNVRTLPSVIPGLWNASCLLPDSGTRFSALKLKVEREYGKEMSFETVVKKALKAENKDETLYAGKQMMNEIAGTVKESLDILKSLIVNESYAFQDTFTITGGQSANADWTQLKANITCMNIAVPECSDAELMGDAVFAFTGLKVFESIKEGAQKLCKIKKIYQPEKI